MVRRLAQRRVYPGLPALPEPTIITNWRLGFIVPLARTNMIIDGSFEDGTTSWTQILGTTVAVSTVQSYHGAYSTSVTGAGPTGSGAFLQQSSPALALVSGSVYAVSMKFLGAAGRRYEYAVCVNGGGDLTVKRFTATGKWQWISFLYTETSSANRRLEIRRFDAGSETYYFDGIQVELCAAPWYTATTYIDGNQQGLLGAREIPPYTWNGTPNASTSNRSGQTRAGGVVIPFTKYGMLLTAIIGLGMAPVDLKVQPYAILDGSNWEDERKNDRTIALTMRWGALTPDRREQAVADLSAMLDRDYLATRQPMVLTAEPLDSANAPTQAPILIPSVTYVGGLEGLLDNLPTGETPITFTQNLPLILTRQAGAVLDVQDTATAGYIMYRDASGQWSVPDTGVTTASAIDQGVHDIAINGLNEVYIAGEFTNAGTSGADNGAVYTSTSGVWSVLASATALNAVANKVRTDAQNRAHYAGAFTNAGGVAAADTYAIYNGIGWSTLGTPTTITRTALALNPTTGNPVLSGNAAASIHWWDGAAWQTGAAVSSGNVFDIIFLPGGTSIVPVGTFLNMGGVADADRVASFDFTTVTALGGPAGGSLASVTQAPNNLIYVSGNPATMNGITTGNVADWNGVQWAGIGNVTPGNVREVSASPRNEIWIGGSSVLTVNGRSGIYLARWNGSTFVPVGLIISNGAVEAIAFDSLGGVWVGWVSLAAGAATSVTFPGRVTVTNEGTDYAYPTLTITGPTSGTARIWQVENQTTGKGLYFDLTMQVGEIVTITTDPVQGLTAVSNVQGNVTGKILPGSNSADFLLQPGSNVIAFLSESNTVTATMTWTTRFNTLPGAIQ